MNIGHLNAADPLARLTPTQRTQVSQLISSYALEDLHAETFHLEALADYITGDISADEALQRIKHARTQAALK